MEVKPGYKQTEAGEIPEDWAVAKLAAVCSMKSGEGITSANIDQFSKYPCYGGNGLRGFAACFTHDGRYALIGRQGALCGNVLGVEGKFFASEHAIVVKTSGRTDTRWLTFVLGKMRLNRYSESSAQPGLSVSKLLSLDVALPPTKAEQEAIAEALSDADALIESLEQLLTKKRHLKQGAMQELLTGKKRLPGFSGEWEVKRLGTLAVLSKSGVNPASSPEVLFTHFSLPAFDSGAVPIVEKGGHIGSNKFLVPKNAILLSKLNPRIPRIWAPSHIPGNAVCSTEFLVLIPNESTDRNYLANLCSSPGVCYQMELHAVGTTGSHQRIHPLQALAIEANTPRDNAEQTAIAAILSDMDTEIAALEAKLAKARQLKQGMMQELLTGRIRLI